MSITPEVQLLITQSLEKVRNDPQHHLKPLDRLAIYKSFGESRLLLPEFPRHDKNSDWESWYLWNVQFYKDELKYLTIADYVLGWLVILTVKKVQPIWERVEYQLNKGDTTFQEILAAAERVLQNTANLDEVYRDHHGNYHFAGAISNFVTFEVLCAYYAVYSALTVVLFGRESYMASFEHITDDGFTGMIGDFASEAVKAFSAVDENAPGVWWREVAMGASFESIEQARSYKPLIFLPQKRLEFWEWWLTEAIPQAWKLADGDK